MPTVQTTVTRPGPLQRTRAASYAASLAVRHLRDEPARAGLLALRVLPAGVRRRVRGAAARGGPLARAHALADAGDTAAAAALLRRAAHGSSPRSLARMAAFALALRDTATADALVSALPKGRRRAALALRSDLVAGRRAPDPLPPVSGEAASATVDRGRRTRRYRTVNVGRSPGTDRAGTLRALHLVTNALPATNAGYTQRTQRIAAAQRALGIDAQVATWPGHPVSAGSADPRPRVEVEGVCYHRLLGWRAPRGAALPGAAGHAAAEHAAAVKLAGALVDRLQPDVLHAASGHRNARLALELGRARGLPVVYEVRGFLEESWLSRDPARSTGDAYYRAERAAETACMAAADLVVTLGSAMRDAITARGIDPDRVLVVPNAVAEPFLEPLPDGGPVRAAAGAGPDTFTVGTTTSCYSYEGLDTLVDAVALLRAREVDAALVVVGDGPELPALRRRAAEAGLGGAAYFPGRVPADQVRAHHAALDVFAVPRRDDRVARLVTPLKPVEAMAGGLPVVASDLPALREAVEPGATGLLVPPEDPAALADALARLAADPALRTRLGTAGRERIGTDRTWAAAARNYERAYTRLVKRK
ncbi:glycosyltransferase [Nocardiopsis coralliicola]